MVGKWDTGDQEAGLPEQAPLLTPGVIGVIGVTVRMAAPRRSCSLPRFPNDPVTCLIPHSDLRVTKPWPS